MAMFRMMLRLTATLPDGHDRLNDCGQMTRGLAQRGAL
jgi:hypothetical protein